MREVCIFDAVRTPRTKGKPDGSLAGVAPFELVRQLVAALGARHSTGVLAAVERLALGCVTQIGPQGGHLALVSRILAGLPDTAVAVTLRASNADAMRSSENAVTPIDVPTATLA